VGRPADVQPRAPISGRITGLFNDKLTISLRIKVSVEKLRVNRTFQKGISAVALVVFGVFALTLLGGMYSVPAIKLTNGREPWLSMLLGLGLALTVFSVGSIYAVPLSRLAVVWGVGILLLLVARWSYGSLDHNVERFGVVHAPTLLLTVFTVMATKLK
jgi:hypothetical protein